MISVVVIAILAVAVDIAQSAHFHLAVPKHPHYDTQYMATVSAVGVRGPESVVLTYRGVRHTREELNTTTLTFHQDGIKTWGVVFPWERMQKLNEYAVRLELSSAHNNLAISSKTLTFSTSSGYIFIQTDKPVYTPRQTVKFRILAVDEYLRLARHQLKVDIMNQKKVIVDRMHYSAEDAFKGQEFELPRETPPGQWSITANYEGLDNSYGTTHTVNFEVKEYVLPRFYGTVSVDKDVITKDDNWVSITVKASYVYGRPVQGWVDMKLGVWSPNTGLDNVFLNYSQPLKKGQLIKHVRMSTLFNNQTRTFKDSKRLYVAVNVTETGTQEVDTIVDTSTFIAHPFYDVTFKDCRTYFKPGFPYTLHIQVRAKNGRPASWVAINVNGTAYHDYSNHVTVVMKTLKLNDKGEATYEVNLADNALSVDFQVTVLDVAHFQIERHTVHRHRSAQRDFLHISMQTAVTQRTDGVVLLRYTRPGTTPFDLDQPSERITLLVTARGHVVHTTSTVRNTDGRSLVKIPASMAPELTPSMRILAFFQPPVGGAGGEDLVIDSLWVDTPDICLEELDLYPLGGSIFGSSEMVKPKDPYTMEIHGGAYMKVGLVAVDKAVFQVQDKTTLSRESMFYQLGRHDRGVDTNDGEDVSEVFKDSGLQHMSIDTSVNMRTADFDHLLSNSHLPRLGKDYYSSFLQRVGTARKDSGPTWPVEIDSVETEMALGQIIPIYIPEAPPQTVRKYFPESWLFQEQELPRSGQLNLNMTMPDSITTWSFLAVGLSLNRGVCVSRPMEQAVQKVFFADLRMPYKVTRLEEIKVRLAIYNYQSYELPVYGRISGVSGTNELCFPALEDSGQWGLNHTAFTLKVPKGGTANYVFPVIPLRDGEVTIRVDLFHERVRDVLEKKLFVVAEGRRVAKYITFVLDPGAKHATYKRSRRNKIFLSKTTAVKNVIDLRKKVQQTTIDLALPLETIRGTEHCRISAFGDLMGDVITHAVMESRSLMEQPTLDAEDVLGDLGPTVHALLYANQSGLMSEELSRRGRRFVRHAVARLLKYHDGSSFRLTADSKPATWLTAVVLKTLCHASSLAFIDRTNLIDAGFAWLLSQVTDNDTLHEQDWRLAGDSFEYRVMLASEVLIALLECGASDHEARLNLETHMAFFLEDNINVIRQPMVLAKLAYALTLFEPQGEATVIAARKLLGQRRKNKLNQVYWAEQPENTESRKIPYWYHRGTKASSVEATAFALKVFMVHNGANVDAIADWLVAQRGSNGAFIGAMDSLAAIQALSAYSLRKHGLDKVDLQCKVSSDRLKNYRYSFNFTEEDATKVKSVNDVPVGHALKVATKGQGLGQMQVSVEYNIPIEKNARCQFNVSVEVKETQVRGMPDMFSNPLCTWCNFGCVAIPLTNATDNETSTNATSTRYITATDRVEQIPDPPMILYDILEPVTMRSSGRAGKNSRIGAPPAGPSRTACRSSYCRVTTRGRRRRPWKTRRPRAASSSHPASSKKSICIQVCLQHKQSEWAGPTLVEIEMLTGYTPVTTDVNRIKADNPHVRAVEFLVETEVLLVHFIRVPSNESTCVSLRAVDDQEVGHPTPAAVLVKPAGQQYTSCALEYKSVHGQESLQVYCADINHSNKGECRCSSGLCGSCHPYTHNEIGISETRDMVCQADIAYQLIIEKFQDNSQWYEIDARVLSVNKTGSHHLRRGEIVKLRTPNSCRCPIWAFGERTDAFYMLAPDVEKLRDRFGNPVYHYVVDDRSRVLRVSDPGQSSSSSNKPAVKFEYLQYVLRTSYSKC